MKKQIEFSLSLLVLMGLIATPVWALKDSRNPNDWYERAHEDLDAAEVLFKETNHYGAVCFHSHQAAEKALKGALINRGDRPDQIHQTAELAKNLSRHNPKSKTFIAPLGELDKLYVPSRYPKQGQGLFSREEASSCLEQAKQVFDLIANEFEVTSGV
ncbi:MAG: HEPN domain-containing protein [Candidatus Omnitrophica bacterium]|nr:HEPN domain-containing protein [Candidatus Omnitrophota bacterium]